MLILWPIRQIEMEHSQYPGIMVLSAFLKERGFPSEVVPADPASVSTRLREEVGGRVILAYSTPTAHAAHFLALNREIKRRFPEALSVFGGAHPTYFPGVIEEDGVDIVCVGEGELALAELAEAIERNQDPSGIQNLWVKRGGTIHRNPIRPLISDLDTLPVPDHLLFLRAARKPPIHAIVMTGRGCPYSCTYCYNNAYKKLYAGKGRVVRRRSVDHVMKELRLLKDEGCRFVRFMDDVFTVSADWIHEFSERYRREIGLPFSCLVRANMITADMARWLKEAGCHRIMMGIEAGNERLRNEVFKRKMSKEHILEAARVIRGAGLKLVTANILGIPGGSLEADWETVDLNIEARPSYASAALLQAFPGTEIHQMAEHMELLQEDNLDQISTGGFGFSSALRYPDEKEHRQVENLHKFFPLLVWFPWLRPLVTRLITLPQNRLYEALYMVCMNIGSHLVAVPPRVGGPMLFKKLTRRFAPWHAIRRTRRNMVT
ncbi:MAG: B12-binding domain-containing radical SAM protein [Acidobacteria bacterium]|nr:B12-binding domain-containing radical SAM protein [Acidobacteriota bacterium]